MLLHYFTAGGIFMWGILLASIFGIAVILEKICVFFMKEKDFTEEYRKNLYKILKTKNKKEIIKITKDKKDSVSKIITKTMENIEESQIEDMRRESLEDIIREAILGQTEKLEKGMWLLGAVVNTAPQIGLLGTVTGMITSFSALSSNNTESAKMVAAGISEALYTTAYGLIVAIPFLIFYNYFNRRIDAIVLEMERAASYIMRRVNTERN